MPKAIDIQPDSYNQILMKGGPGFGKTLAAATFALEGPVHISYFDKKKPVELITFFTEKRFGEKAKRILNNIEYTVYGAYNAHEYLNRLIDMANRNSCRLFADITDSTTSLTSAAVNWSLAFSEGKSKVIKDAEEVIPGWDDYKVETSLISQALDLYQNLPCHVIWTAHPLPSIKLEGSGRNMKVTKTNPIVTYGAKVAGIIPGRFTEIYHMYQESEWDAVKMTNNKKFMVSVDAIGDDFAKSSIFTGSDVKSFDITDRLFYEVWKDEISKAFKKEETTT